MQCEWRSGFQTSASPKQQCLCQVPKEGDIGRAITLTVYHIHSWRQCACPMQLLLGDELCPAPSSCIPSAPVCILLLICTVTEHVDTFRPHVTEPEVAPLVGRGLLTCVIVVWGAWHRGENFKPTFMRSCSSPLSIIVLSDHDAWPSSI